jgi:hypothetical protein
MSMIQGTRLRVPIFLCLIIFGLPPAIWAQNRVIGRVAPNQTRINSNAELYDPSSGTFTLTAGTMVKESSTGAYQTARTGHTETKLANGTVLITGGTNDVDYLQSAEIYTPSTQTFALTTKVDQTTLLTKESDMIAPRTGHTATLLNDGKVLIVGGYNSSYLNTAELYEPATGVFTTITGTLTTARAYHTAVLQPDGQVMIAGGYNGSYLNTVEIFNPKLLTFTTIAATIGDVRAHHTATLMSTLKVLITGGYNNDNNGDYLSTAVIYDPSTLAIQNTNGLMITARSEHTACATSDGKVLIVGGTNGSPLASAETFDPSTGNFTATASAMTVARDAPTATPMFTGKVLIAGGGNGNPLASAEIYDPSSRTFTATSSPMNSARQGHAAAALLDGRILLAGGQNAQFLSFDYNSDTTDNIPPNIVFSSDSSKGFVSFTGSGAVVVFSPATGAVLQTIQTGGYPFYITPLPDNHTLAVVSAFDNKIFLIDMNSLQVTATLSFTNAHFGFGSIVTVSHNGSYAYVSSTGSSEVIKFSLPNGTEVARLGGLQTPSQITITPDDSTLMVVDTGAVQVIFVNPATMKQSYVLSATNYDTGAVFDIDNAVVLSKDGKMGIIASQGVNAYSTYTVFIFKVSDGTVLASEQMNNVPGYTTLTPDGLNWVILANDSLLVVPLANPDGKLELSSQGEPLVGSNLIISPDSRYAYYASATSDLFLKEDLSSVSVVGSLNVGDDPNVRSDQSSSVAVTPDGNTMVALNFNTNNLALIGLDTILDSARFVSGHDQFTSISIINLSGSTANLTITAMHDYGSEVSGANVNNTNIVNPATVSLAPNAQLSTTVDQLFNFDGQTDQSGWLIIESDHPGIVGYVSWGAVKGSFLGSYIAQCDGTLLFNASPADDSLIDWIVPEVSRATGTTTEVNFLNRDYNTGYYDLYRMTTDGAQIVETTANSITNEQRLSQNFVSAYTQPDQGYVVIVGGENGTGTLNTAEYYNTTGIIFAASSGVLNTAVQSQMAVLLSSGRILIAGGKDSNGNIVNFTEIYDPSNEGSTTSGVTPLIATTGAMNVERVRGTMTLLQDGRVLIAGGQSSVTTLNTAETYDPTSDSFGYTTGTMVSPRDSHTATLLQNGKVLIAGGSDGSQVVNTAELFDPRTGKFTSTGNMTTARAFHTATLLSNGLVLITGGYNGSYIATGEIYDPSTGTFSLIPDNMTNARAYHTATRLADGRVLIAGGTDASTVYSTADLYDPGANLFLPSAGAMSFARKSHAAALLVNLTSSPTATDNKVLLLGGTDGTNILSSADLYDPVLDTFTAANNAMTAPRTNFTATFLGGGTEGYLRVKSTTGMFFTEVYNNGKDTGAMNGIEVARYSGIHSLYSPQFATVAGFTTTLNVINANTSTAQVTITLHGPSGNVIGTPAAVTLETGQQLKQDLVSIFGNDPAVKNVTGWLEIDSSVDEVVGTITFSNANGDFLTTFELQGTPLNDFIFPLVSQNDTYLSGIALLNQFDASNGTATATVELWGQNGTLMRSTTITLASGSQRVFYINQLFPNLGSVLVSNVRIHTDTPLFGISLLMDNVLHFISAVPPIPFPSIR